MGVGLWWIPWHGQIVHLMQFLSTWRTLAPEVPVRPLVDPKIGPGAQKSMLFAPVGGSVFWLSVIFALCSCSVQMGAWGLFVSIMSDLAVIQGFKRASRGQLPVARWGPYYVKSSNLVLSASGTAQACSLGSLQVVHLSKGPWRSSWQGYNLHNRFILNALLGFTSFNNRS